MSALQQQFDAFDRENPRVWQLFVEMTRRVINAGHIHYSSDAVLHAIRWHMDVVTKSEDGFKINNNYSAHYARKFHDCYPQHDGFFRLRRTRDSKPITGAKPRHDREVNALPL